MGAFPAVKHRLSRNRTAFDLAKAQLAGGHPWGEIIMGSSSICVCQHCGVEFHVTAGLEPCAFCNDCKDAVLEKLAEALVKFERMAPRREQSRERRKRRR